MNLTSIGTVSSFVKNKQLTAKWNERKSQLQQLKSTPNPMIVQLQRQAVESQRTMRLTMISSKMESGSRLSASDMEYLRVHSPDTYEKAVRIQREREAYERDLKNCRSKEDVERLKQSKLNQFVVEGRAIMSSPNIPKAQKGELMQFLKMRMNAILKAHAEFISSPEYYRLPEKDQRMKDRNQDAVWLKHLGNSPAGLERIIPAIGYCAEGKPISKPAQPSDILLEA